MVAPKPVSLTQVDEANYDGPFDPEPLVIVGPIPGGGGGGGGGDVASVNGKTGTVVLTATDVGAAPTNHTQSISSVTGLQDALDSGQQEINDLSDVVATKASTADMTAALSGKASAEDLDNVFAIATAAVPQTRTVAGKPLSSDITLSKVDVGLASVDNTSDVNKPVSTAQQTALDGKVPTTRTVAGKPLSADVTLAKADVGLSNVDNTSDANKPISSATQTALNAKAPIASPTFTGTVGGISKSMVGLGNVDNTSDANKPVSTAQASAIAAKVGSPNSSVSGLALYPTVGDLPATGTAGVIYYVDAV